MTWETPPPPNHSYDWVDVARLLRSRPHEWLRVYEEGPISIVNAIRQSSIAALQPISRRGLTYGFEVRTRNNNVANKTCSLYLRWLPPAEGGDNDATATSGS